jgi:type VI secretion system protein ImpL
MSKPPSFPTAVVWITASVALVLILAALLAGPRIGMQPAASYWAALAILALWVLCFIVLLIVRRVRATRRIAGFSPGTSPAASPEPFGAAAFGERLNRTIQWLKKSKLAETGKDPVYELPWYLFVGLPGSGKSTLIVQSGFSFSYTEPKKPLGRPSVSPTDGCDLWVANEAVFIDPSGKYFADDGAQDAWPGVLYQIKQRRTARPADGIVLVIDVDCLIGMSHDALRVQAERTRSFLDATAKAFGMVLPVYMLFCKADLIEGFEEFFAQIANGGSTPLGATFRQEQYQNPHPEEEFKNSFDEIYKAFLDRRASVLAASSGRAQEKAFAFPAQFPLIREQLSEFVEVLLQMNQFREQPLFRGFYFTSSLQTGNSRSPIAELMASKAGLPRAAQDSPSQQAKNYFIHALFTGVVIPDRGLAGLSREVRRRRMRLRVAVLALAGIVLPVGLLAFAWRAYQDSSGLNAATEIAQGISTGDGKTSENLSMLLDLEQRLEVFECRGQTGTCQDRGRRFHWGLYPGDAALNLARRTYLDKVKTLFMDPLFNADTRLGQKYNGLKTQLDSISTQTAAGELDPGKAYTLLKTFLMFSSETKANPSFLLEQTQDYWCQGVQDQKRPQALEILRFYLHQLGDHQNPAYRLTRTLADNETIDRLRKMLLVVEPDRYYYGIIRDEGKRKVDSISVGGIAGTSGMQVFEVGAPVDGPYTKIGWDTFVKDRIAAMKKDYEEERSWVLGTSAVSPGELKIDEKLRSYYFRDYQQSWWDFLKGIGVKRFSSFEDAAQKLALLTDAQQSPMILLFKSVSLNTWDDLDPLKAGELSQAQAAIDGAGGLRFGVARNFQAIHALVAKKEKQDPALTEYLKTLTRLLVVIRTFLDANQPAGQIADIGREADAALQATNGLLVNFDANARQAVEPLLKQPVQQVVAILNKSTPVGTVKDLRQRGLAVGGSVKEKGKNLQGATVMLLEGYSESKFLADKEIMRTQTQDGNFNFPNPINPGPFKICAAKKGDTNYFCADVRLDRDSNGKPYELRRPRSMVVFGGGKLDLVLQIR